jgi:hypothetical protein
LRTRRKDRSGAWLAVLIALGPMLVACSADLSLNNLTLAPRPETTPRKPESPSQTWGRGSFERSITTADLVGSDGQCALASAPPAAPGQAESAASLGPISLRMTECEVVRRAGPVEKIDGGTNERGERSLVLTYLHGPWPGLYRFAGGRLISIERAPAPSGPAEKPQKATATTKKPPGS